MDWEPVRATGPLSPVGRGQTHQTDNTQTLTLSLSQKGEGTLTTTGRVREWRRSPLSPAGRGLG